jgi:hypothetical protein
MLILGIDPGASGALAWLDDGHLLDVVDMPVVDKDVSAALLCRALASVGVDVAVVEQAQSMPRQGVASSFRYGVCYGVILGCLAAHAIPVTHVRPTKWKKAMGLGPDKDKSRRMAIDLWPDRADLFARKKDDGRAEAALLAEYGRTHTHTKEGTDR